jgi:uncharacterized protein (DUF1697 family)
MGKTNYLALLRAINVGGKNTIKMDELKKIFEKMQFSDVKTHIQTGNILFFDNEKDKLKLARKIEKALLNETKNEIMVLILTLSDIKDIIKDIPKEFGNNNEKYKYDVLFLIDPLKPKDIMNEIKIIKGEDKIFEGEKALYVKRLAEKLTGSYIVKALNISENITVRNLKITKELYKLMLERNVE